MEELTQVGNSAIFGITGLADGNITLGNILLLVLIAVGILIIFLAIALLMRMKKTSKLIEKNADSIFNNRYMKNSLKAEIIKEILEEIDKRQKEDMYKNTKIIDHEEKLDEDDIDQITRNIIIKPRKD